MNPETGKFENLQEEFIKETGMTDLLRPDGTPVPKTWLVCGVGDLVTVERNGRSHTFKVCYVGESCLVLEPAKRAEKTEAQVKRLREALKLFANDACWDMGIHPDDGSAVVEWVHCTHPIKFARQALKETE